MWSTRLSWQIFWPCALALTVTSLAWLAIAGLLYRQKLSELAAQELAGTSRRVQRQWQDFRSDPGVAHDQHFLHLVQLWLADNISLSLLDEGGTVLGEITRKGPSALGTSPAWPAKGSLLGEGQVQLVRAAPPAISNVRFWVMEVPLEASGQPLHRLRLSTPVAPWYATFAAPRRTTYLGLGAIFAATLLVLAWQLDRRLRPMQRLTEMAAQIAQGAKGDALQLTETNELRDLARALYALQGRLAQGVQELQASGIRQETVLSAMTDGVLAVDREENILFANGAVQALLDLPLPPRVGRPLLESVRIHSIHRLVTRAMQTGEGQEEDIELNTVVPRVLQLRTTCMPGLPCPGAVVVLHDLSDARRLERLRQEFVANVSHELKTPLSSIKAYAETLRHGAIHDTANCLKFLGRIEEHADRLDALIADLLRLARIESGQKAFDIRPVHVATVVQQRLLDHQASAESKAISLRVSAGDTLLHVRADEEGLRQILDNLINNAIKYTPDHGHVTLRWFRSGGTVAIEVEDTGIGISVVDQKRVFERFYRVDKARSREQGGTGLGLAIVKHLVQFFQGQVYVRSELGQGTTFGVKLPMSSPP